MTLPQDVFDKLSPEEKAKVLKAEREFIDRRKKQPDTVSSFLRAFNFNKDERKGIHGSGNQNMQTTTD